MEKKNHKTNRISLSLQRVNYVCENIFDCICILKFNKVGVKNRRSTLQTVTPVSFTLLQYTQRGQKISISSLQNKHRLFSTHTVRVFQ